MPHIFFTRPRSALYPTAVLSMMPDSFSVKSYIWKAVVLLERWWEMTFVTINSMSPKLLLLSEQKWSEEKPLA
jgi:hypothetical protein